MFEVAGKMLSIGGQRKDPLEVAQSRLLFLIINYDRQLVFSEGHCV